MQVVDDLVPEIEEYFVLTLRAVDGGARLANNELSTSTKISINANDEPYGIVALSKTSVSVDPPTSNPDDVTRALRFTISRAGGTLLPVFVSASIKMASSPSDACGADSFLEIEFADFQAFPTAYPDYGKFSVRKGGRDVLIPKSTFTLDKGAASKDVRLEIPVHKFLPRGTTFCVSLESVVLGVGTTYTQETLLESPRLSAVNSAATTQVDTAVSNGVISFGQGNSVITEGETKDLTVIRNDGFFGPVSVPWSVEASTAIDPAAGMVKFAHSEQTTILKTSAINDDIPELRENLVITLADPLLGSAKLAVGGGGKMIIEIPENDEPYGSLGFSFGAYDVMEALGKINVSVVRDRGTFKTVGITVGSADASAVAGLHYQAIDTKLTFLERETHKFVIVDVQKAAGQPIAPERNFTLSLSNRIGNVEVGEIAQATVRIHSCIHCEFNIAEDDQTVVANEPLSDSGPTKVEIGVVRSPHAFGDATVQWKLEAKSESDKSGDDFASYGGVVVFKNRERRHTILLEVLADDLEELNEGYTLTLFAPTGETTLGASILSDIMIPFNDHPSGLFSISQTASSVAEPDAFEQVHGITLTRSYGSVGKVSVVYATARAVNSVSCCAEENEDYVPFTRQVTFLAGQTSKTVSVTILNDTTPEMNESFVMEIKSALVDPADVTKYYSAVASPENPVSISSTERAIELTIRENDAARGVISFAAPEFYLYEGAVANAFTLRRDAGLFTDIAVRWAVVAARKWETCSGANVNLISAQDGVDYVVDVGGGGVVEFAEGDVSATGTIIIQDDDIPEDAEVIAIKLMSASAGVTLAEGNQVAGLVIVSNDDPFGVFEFADPTSIVVATEQEADTIVFIPVQRRRGTARTVRIPWSADWDRTDNLSAQVGPLVPGTITVGGEIEFLPGQTVQNVNVTIRADDDPELLQSFQVQLGNATEYFGGFCGDASKANLAASLTNAAAAKVRVDIAGNDFPHGVIEFQTGVPSYSVGEEDGDFTLKVYRRGGTTGTVSVNYSTVGLSAKPDVDYVHTSGVLTFPDGVSEQSINIKLLGDAEAEPEERFHVILTNPTNGSKLGLASELVSEQKGVDEAKTAATNLRDTADTLRAVALNTSNDLDQALAKAKHALLEEAAVSAETQAVSSNLTRAEQTSVNATADYQSATEARKQASADLDTATQSLNSANSFLQMANQSLFAAKANLANTVARSIDFTEEPGTIQFVSQLPADDSTQEYFAGLQITAHYYINPSSQPERHLAVRATKGFGVVGATCGGTCISGNHRVSFGFKTSVVSLSCFESSIKKFKPQYIEV